MIKSALVALLISGWSSIVLPAVIARAAAAPAANQRYDVLHRFLGAPDGSNPAASLISDARGNLYGTTEYGGDGNCNADQEFSGCGAVVMLSRKRSTGWQETVLHRFGENAGDGLYPRGGLVFDREGNLYGTTAGGGSANCACGTVFELIEPGAGIHHWTEKILHSFQGDGDGAEPAATLVFGHDGMLYGTTASGGTYCGLCGTAFQLSQDKSGVWSHTVLHSFGSGNDGYAPEAALLTDGTGALYGTTVSGGYYSIFCASGCGTVFQLTQPKKAGDGWTETVLLEFQGNDGASPYASLVMDNAGNFYGTTMAGLSGKGAFTGTVFELTLQPGQSVKWSERVLHRFGTDGGPAAPVAGVVIDKVGDLFGTTVAGGLATYGTVYRLEPSEGKITILHQFLGGRDGAYAEAGLVLGNDGRLYGTTFDGGDTRCSIYHYDDCGVLFSVAR